MKYFVYSVIFIVFAAIIAGFFIVGLPEEERLRKFDEKKLADLRFIQSEIFYYWDKTGNLPEKLDVLNDNIRGIIIPKDQETGNDYSYEIKSEDSFSLCANFNSSSKDKKSGPQPLYYPYYDDNENWLHDSGKTCFERKINRDVHKPKAERIK